MEKVLGLRHLPTGREMQPRFQSNSGGGCRRSLPDMGRPGPLARYALVWTAAAAVVVLVTLGAIRAFDDEGRSREVQHRAPAGVLPAARAAGCSYSRIEGPAESAPRSPPVAGHTRVEPALDGAYVQAPPVGSLVAALARGRVVIQYREPVAGRERALLERLYDVDRGAMILTPDQTDMDGVVAATAWRRLLACPRIDSSALRALAEFRDRFRGRGPK
jgi:Protein of unknown function (DUF3105)